MSPQLSLDKDQNEIRIPITSNEHVMDLFTRSVSLIGFEKLQALAKKYPLPGVRLALNELAAATEIHSSSLERKNLRLIAKAGYDINQFEAVRLEPLKESIGFELVCRRIREATDDEVNPS